MTVKYFCYLQIPIALDFFHTEWPNHGSYVLLGKLKAFSVSYLFRSSTDFETISDVILARQVSNQFSIVRFRSSIGNIYYDYTSSKTAALQTKRIALVPCIVTDQQRIQWTVYNVTSRNAIRMVQSNPF